MGSLSTSAGRGELAGSLNSTQFTKPACCAVVGATGAIPTFEPFVSFRYKQRILILKELRGRYSKRWLSTA